MSRLLINCDLGEWDARHLGLVDHIIMPHIDMCNIALGSHAGSITIIKYSVQLATNHRVKIGAHPGYNDRDNFGRTPINLSDDAFVSMIDNQLELLQNISSQMNTEVYHVKPHGALYHKICDHEKYFSMFYNLISEKYSHLKIVCRAKSKFATFLQKENADYLAESFIDRAYNSNLTLKDRGLEDAVIEDVELASKQYSMLANHKIQTISNEINLSSTTACIHGDNPKAISILQSIRKSYTK